MGLVKTCPLFFEFDFWHSAAFHVSAQHEAKEGRQDALLLQRGRESSVAGLQDGAADGFVSGRDQRSAASRLAQVPGGLRRGPTRLPNHESVPGRPGSASRRARQRTGEIERPGIAASADLWCLLAGMRALASTRPG